MATKSTKPKGRMPDNKDGLVLNATLLIYNADQMSDAGRRELAKWLRQCANHLVEHGAEYAPRFRVRRMSVDEMRQDEVHTSEEGIEKVETFIKSTQPPKLAVSDYAAGQRLKVQRAGG